MALADIYAELSIVLVDKLKRKRMRTSELLDGVQVSRGVGENVIYEMVRNGIIIMGPDSVLRLANEPVSTEMSPFRTSDEEHSVKAVVNEAVRIRDWFKNSPTTYNMSGKGGNSQEIVDALQNCINLLTQRAEYPYQHEPTWLGWTWRAHFAELQGLIAQSSWKKAATTLAKMAVYCLEKDK